MQEVGVSNLRLDTINLKKKQHRFRLSPNHRIAYLVIASSQNVLKNIAHVSQLASSVIQNVNVVNVTTTLSMNLQYESPGSQ